VSDESFQHRSEQENAAAGGALIIKLNHDIEAAA
jgi:hypothetical protein